MSLSFVSTAVLKAKEGGDGYEETPIASNDTAGSSSRTTGASKPLFDQLRANQEQEEEEREEFQKSIMRGTLALDEDDCAHLDALQQQKLQRDQEIKRQTQSELASFRAAQQMSRMGDDDEADDEDQKHQFASAATTTTSTSVKPRAKPIAVPKITVVKKRRRLPENAGNSTATHKKEKSGDTQGQKPDDQGKSNNSQPALAGLLAGYGSDDSSD